MYSMASMTAWSTSFGCSAASRPRRAAVAEQANLTEACSTPSCSVLDTRCGGIGRGESRPGDEAGATAGGPRRRFRHQQAHARMCRRSLKVPAADPRRSGLGPVSRGLRGLVSLHGQDRRLSRRAGSVPLPSGQASFPLLARQHRWSVVGPIAASPRAECNEGGVANRLRPGSVEAGGPSRARSVLVGPLRGRPGHPSRGARSTYACRRVRQRRR